MFVTAQTEVGRELREAFDALGLSVAVAADDTFVVDGTPLGLPVLERAHPHPGTLAGLVADNPGPHLLLADRISDSGRAILRDAGWSWLDRRGHMRLWVPGLRVDAPIGLRGDSGRGNSTSPWTPVGLEVALWALIHSDEPVAARRVAADIGRSAGGTQEIINRFGAHGLIGHTSRLPLLPDLFWEAVAHWPDDGWLALPVPIEAAAEAAGESALLRVDERAATLGGARIPAAIDLPARCYVGKGAMRRLRQLAEPGRPALTHVRIAPLTWLPENPDFRPDAAHPWRIGHPLLCALRLARDDSRGREIVEDWGVIPGER